MAIGHEVIAPLQDKRMGWWEPGGNRVGGWASVGGVGGVKWERVTELLCLINAGTNTDSFKRCKGGRISINCKGKQNPVLSEIFPPSCFSKTSAESIQ